VNADTRNWATTVLAGLVSVGIGCYDAFVDHAATFATTGDVVFIVAGLGVLGVKVAYDVGVQVPTPPKP
jgi:hypothetical protein